METNVNYTLVGAFVIALITAIVLGIIWLSSGFSFEQYSTYLIYMQESVSGLNIDSDVEYNGVEVGTVKSIELNQNNPQLVEVLVDIKNTTPITHGTVATLTTRGLTGLVYVALKDKSVDLRPLVAEPGQRYPVIPTAPSIFVRLDAALTQLNRSFKRISESMEVVFDEENQQSIKRTLLNLKRITNTLAMNSKPISVILKNTEKASQQFAPLLQSGRGAFNMIQTQTLPSTYQLVSNLNEISRHLAIITEEIKQNPSVLIRGTAEPSLGPGETN